MSGRRSFNVHAAIALVHSCVVVPIIPFSESQEAYSESDFDLVVPALSHPQEWLADLKSLIECSAAVRRELQIIQEQSARLGEECQKLREKSQAEKKRAFLERNRMREFLNKRPWDFE